MYWHDIPFYCGYGKPMKPLRVNLWNSIMDTFGPSELALSRGVRLPAWLTVIYCLIFPVNGRRDVRKRNRRIQLKSWQVRDRHGNVISSGKQGSGFISFPWRGRL